MVSFKLPQALSGCPEAAFRALSTVIEEQNGGEGNERSDSEANPDEAASVDASGAADRPGDTAPHGDGEGHADDGSA